MANVYLFSAVVEEPCFSLNLMSLNGGKTRFIYIICQDLACILVEVFLTCFS